ncbi:hypothetical protein SMMN14_06753 [Sphaerulina musiva]
MKSSIAAAVLALSATSAFAAPTPVEQRNAEPEAFLKALADNLGGFGGIPGLQALSTVHDWITKRDITHPGLVAREADPEAFLKALADNLGGFGGIPGLQALSTVHDWITKRDITHPALVARDAVPEPGFLSAFGKGARIGLRIGSSIFGIGDDNQKRDATPEPFLGGLAKGAKLGLRIGSSLFDIIDKREVPAALVARDAEEDDTPEFIIYTEEDLEKRDAAPEPFLSAFGKGARIGLRIGSSIFGIGDDNKKRDATPEPFLGGFAKGAKIGLRIGSSLFDIVDKRDAPAALMARDAEEDDIPELVIYTEEDLEKRDAAPEPGFLSAFGKGAKIGLRIGSSIFGFGDDNQKRDAVPEPFLKAFGQGARIGLRIGSSIFGFGDNE